MTTISRQEDYRSALEALSMPCDQRREAERTLASGDESQVVYHRELCSGGLTTHYLYFPQSCRGAIAEGGDSVWTDCLDLDDLRDRWSNQDRLSN